MKKKIFLTLTVTLIASIIFCSQNFSLHTHNAHASSLYLRVITEDTPFYKNITDQAPLFYLPYTYYVKVIGSNNGFYHVECYGNGTSTALDGYVPESFLFNDGLAVTYPYVSLNITTVNTTILYADSELKNNLQYVFQDRTLQYYGSLLTDNGTIYYVGYNNRLGYVKESDVFPFSIPNHPNELTFIQPEIPETPETPTENSPQSSATPFDLRFAIIACLIFAGLVALFIAFTKGTPTKTAVSYYDENDYE